jgi:hypothetical protein
MPATNEIDREKLIAAVHERHTKVENLIAVSERICQKLESPDGSVTILDQDALRAALDALSNAARS